MAYNEDFTRMMETAKFVLRINQKELAKLLGCSESFLSEIKKGNKKASGELFEKLSALLPDTESVLERTPTPKNNTKDRLLEFLRYKGMGQQKFENSIGMSNGWVNKVGNTIRENSLQKIKEVYPELNIAWLISGAGSMLTGESEGTLETSGDSETGEIIQNYNHLIMTKIDRYKILIRYLISIGVANSQQELGTKVGYNSASAFSQVINCKVSEPKNFMNKLKDLLPNLNLEWLETGQGEMLLSEEGSTNIQETTIGGQQFNGVIFGDNPQFAGHDLNNNPPPCVRATDFEKFIVALTAQADLTKEAHEITRNAQAQVDRAQTQIDRLITMLEVKFNITNV